MAELNNVAFTGKLATNGALKHIKDFELYEGEMLIADDKAPFKLGLQIWGKKATELAPKLLVGTRIAVSGTLRFNTWTDTYGTDHERYAVNVATLVVIGGENVSF